MIRILVLCIDAHYFSERCRQVLLEERVYSKVPEKGRRRRVIGSKI